MSNTRPCLVHMQKENVHALFHMFCMEAYPIEPSPLVGGTPGGQVCTTFALVEFDDGTVHRVGPTQIQFIDKLKVTVSTDAKKVSEIRQALKDNDGYCPCELQQTPDTKCMCKAFREQTTPGPCHCGLYVKEVQNG